MSSDRKIARIKIDAKKNSVQFILIALNIIFFSANAFAESKEWKTEIIDGGKTTVQWNITKNKDGLPIIDYSLKSTAQVSMRQLISTLKDVNKHKVFNEDKDSKILETLSDNEWVIYYFIGAPWPLKDPELVAKMVFREDRSKNIATFKITVDPSIYRPKTKDVTRFSVYDLTYVFKDIGNGYSEISITSKKVAPFKVPVWLINASFPNRPVGIFNRMVKLASEVH